MIDCEVWWARPLPGTDALTALLTSAERERYETYRREEDSRRFLTGRVLAKTAAGDRLGLPASSVEFDATCEDCGKQHGPPRVVGGGVALSISHSGDRVGVAVTSGEPVGLDVETTKRNADDALLEYALNERETAELAGLSADERAAAFFVYWTRKEAVMKATGRGLRIPLRSLTISAPHGKPELIASGEDTLAPEATRMADLDPGDGYRAAVAVLTGDELSVVERWWEPSEVWRG
ncbi:4'-phosphopantetheinyl transferase [Prauserella marina]|uniref:4'-phosphopantetheinyl transferase n=1 Tax=Prauserella marina TaxID=530584 RepID=A0A222VW49_9PSEU|nr:4'-phosphopantetheinyl transferase superfamily protein [Prauserella marina]ASR38159.1 4'-phosphopantetheinyl transferase [Prauserella marina]PWV78668.1 4'-phosphopantetheinyl transferase [Prauserella marina]SDC91132.1 4'-phosphopantetheinyl transferase [Prauserella marina]